MEIKIEEEEIKMEMEIKQALQRVLKSCSS
jgi:hypothetical protein